MTLLYFVDLYQLDKDARQQKIATFKLREEGNLRMVEIEGDCNHPIVENLKGEGIFDYKRCTPEKFFLYDGMNFLENLKYHFRSGYLAATDVQRKIVD